MVRLHPRLRSHFPEIKRVYTAATRAVAPATARLSTLRGGWVPTGIALTMEQAAASSGGRCVVARPAEILARPAAPGSPVGHPTFASVGAQIIPRVAVAELPRGRVMGPKSAVITGRNDLLHELSLYFGTTRPREHPVFLEPFPPPPLEVSGRLGVLASRGDANYYHFMVDVLPRLGILEATSVAPPERWYVPTGARFQRDLLTRMGVPESMWLDRDEHPHVRAETLVVPGLAATHVLNPPWVTEFLRERLIRPDDIPTERRRIYVTRGAAQNNRAVVGEDAVIARLEKRGFTAVEPGGLTLDEQIRTFAGAETIVAAHGAALTNLIFTQPGAGVLELHPGAPVLQDCYWTLARSVPGLSYRYLIGAPPAGDVKRDLNAGLVSDIDLDLDELEREIDLLEAAKDSRVDTERSGSSAS